MGCNTSKETVPTTEEKENEANNEEVNKTGDNEQIENQGRNFLFFFSLFLLEYDLNFKTIFLISGF